MATQRIRLVMFEGPEPGKEYEISGRVSIGRGKDADIQIEDVSISRKHVEIWTEQGVFYWKDLNSTNGVFHNTLQGERGDLVHGDRLRVGDVDFDVCEGKRAVRPRSDEDLLPGRRKAPQRQKSSRERMRKLLMLCLIAGIFLLGVLAYKNYQYRRHEAPITWKLGEKPFVQPKLGFELLAPTEKDDWFLAVDVNKSGEWRDWGATPPLLGNGMIMANEVFSGYNVYGWNKTYFGQYRVTIFVEVLQGVSEELDIIDYSIARRDLPKLIAQSKPDKPNPKQLASVPWATGMIGEEMWGGFEGQDGTAYRTLERGYCAYGNRYLIMVVAQENFMPRIAEGVTAVMESFKAVKPEAEIDLALAREIENDANNLFREGRSLAEDGKHSYGKLYQAFVKLREANLLYKKLEQPPFEARQAMNDLNKTQKKVQAHLDSYLRECRNWHKLGRYQDCIQACENIRAIVKDKDEDWRRWADEFYYNFNQALVERKSKY